MPGGVDGRRGGELHREAYLPAEREGADGRGPRAHEAARGPGQGDTAATRADVRAQGGTQDTAEAVGRAEEAQQQGDRKKGRGSLLRCGHSRCRGLASAGELTNLTPLYSLDAPRFVKYFQSVSY